MRQLILAFLLVTSAANAQLASFGFKGGIPVMDAVRKGRFSSLETLDTGRWTVGPTVEFRVGSGFSLEIDALLRGYSIGGNYASPAGPGLSPVFYSTRREVRAWDFPFLLKYRLRDGVVRPFVTAGVSITHESTDYSITTACLGPTSCNPPETPDAPDFQSSASSATRNRRGIVAGAGFEFRHGRIIVSPEFRYTRLNNLGTNQAAVFLGIRF
jgi:hypothetical protein